jgi:hypothetical protein
MGVVSKCAREEGGHEYVIFFGVRICKNSRKGQKNTRQSRFFWRKKKTGKGLMFGFQAKAWANSDTQGKKIVSKCAQENGGHEYVKIFRVCICKIVRKWQKNTHQLIFFLKKTQQILFRMAKARTNSDK